MDTPTVVAVLAFAGAVITAILAVVGAVITNRSEKQQSAQTAAEKGLEEQLDAKDERIVFRDELIARLTQDNLALQGRNEELTERSYSIRDRLHERDTELRLMTESRDHYKALYEQALERERGNGK